MIDLKAQSPSFYINFLKLRIFSTCLTETSLSTIYVYRKPTFSGVYTHFDSFLPTTHKFSIIYTLVFRCSSISSNWTNFHNELVFLKDIYLKNRYPISFIDKCFKTSLDRFYLKRPQVF